MKKILYFFIVCWPLTSVAQDSINPYNISQSCNIILHDSNVYYNPFAPPATTDTRANLCNIATQLNDPNGTTRESWLYEPVTHGIGLMHWHPCGGPTDTLGPTAVWQRLFTAQRDSLGHAHDIVAGGNVGERVTISANEDVDFRASGRIKLKSGFKVMPGAFFHAYTEPKWDTTVFSDEFDSTALDRSKWYVSTGQGDLEVTFQCSSDSDARTVIDPDAHDGHALDIDLREMVPGDTCSCYWLKYNVRAGCDSSIASPLTIKHFLFATSNIQSCPVPWLAEDSPWTNFYQHAPYGKYEIREKIPHILHHTNDWGWNGWEWDMGETVTPSDSMKFRDIGFVLNLRHGPFMGKFGTAVGHTDSVFRSRAAHFSATNTPTSIFINNFMYNVNCYFTPTDTFLTAVATTAKFPTSLTSSTDSFSFNYERTTSDTADNLTWNVAQYGTDTVWKIFSAAYRDSSGYLKYFSKDYQPTSVTLTSSFAPPKTYSCYWRADLNDTGTGGVLWLDNGLDSSDFHSHTERYIYTVDEDYDCPTPPVPFDGNDTTGGYVYHTYTMELLPNELRYLIDGNVVRRYPDRLVPPGSKYYNPPPNIMRGATYLNPAEFGIHQSTYTYTDSTGTHTYNDSLGTHSGTSTYIDRQYFESHLSNPGMWDVEIPPGSGKWYHAAHHLIDYIKIWDVPKDVKIPNFPQ